MNDTVIEFLLLSTRWQSSPYIGSFIIFCLRADLAFSSLLSLPITLHLHICSIYLKVVFHLISSSVLTFFSFTISSSISLEGSFFLTSGPAIIFFSYQIQHYSFSTLSNTASFLSVHFTCSILLHIRISYVSSHFFSLHPNVQVCAPHSTHSTSLVSSSVIFPRICRKFVFFYWKLLLSLLSSVWLLDSSSCRSLLVVYIPSIWNHVFIQLPYFEVACLTSLCKE